MQEDRISRDATTDQLRDDIDRGRTGAKRARRDGERPDVAAAPLGTDDEAAGRSPQPELIARSRRRESAEAVVQRENAPWLWHLIAIGLVIVALAVGLYLLIL